MTAELAVYANDIREGRFQRSLSLLTAATSVGQRVELRTNITAAVIAAA